MNGLRPHRSGPSPNQGQSPEFTRALTARLSLASHQAAEPQTTSGGGAANDIRRRSRKRHQAAEPQTTS
ncbi:MAG TPA: hypothetical protein VFS77_02720, partial [Pyrinomonadaceae bacterium]|nr:hypothetical protein [Pyrinomonadaceae bacterium]